MNSLSYISKQKRNYYQYNDYIFKQTVQRRANGVLKLLGIPYTINNIILSEITDLGPKIHRLDFAGETIKNGEDICFVLECQSQLPTDDDILRFFQYVSSLLVLKKKKVELYILCMQKAPYDKKEFVLNDDCTYTMHVISLKDIKANDIFNIFVQEFSGFCKPEMNCTLMVSSYYWSYLFFLVQWGVLDFSSNALG